MMNMGARSVMAAVMVVGLAGLAAAPQLVAQQKPSAPNPFPGGTNPDGSLRPTPPVTRLFTQDAYTEYALLDPDSQSFRIRFLPEETRAGATEIVNATRGGSAGSDIEVFDPRSGQPAANRDRGRADLRVQRRARAEAAGAAGAERQ